MEEDALSEAYQEEVCNIFACFCSSREATIEQAEDIFMERMKNARKAYERALELCREEDFDEQ